MGRLQALRKRKLDAISRLSVMTSFKSSNRTQVPPPSGSSSPLDILEGFDPLPSVVSSAITPGPTAALLDSQSGIYQGWMVPGVDAEKAERDGDFSSTFDSKDSEGHQALGQASPSLNYEQAILKSAVDESQLEPSFVSTSERGNSHLDRPLQGLTKVTEESEFLDAPNLTRQHGRESSLRGPFFGTGMAASAPPLSLLSTVDLGAEGRRSATARLSTGHNRHSEAPLQPRHTAKTLNQFDRLVPNFVCKHVRSYVDGLVSQHDELLTEKLTSLTTHDGFQESTELIPVMKPSVVDDFAVVVMADVSGYSKLCAELADRGIEGTEILAAIMKGLMDKIIQIISVHGGDIVKFVGDAVIFCWRLSAASPSKRRSSYSQSPIAPYTRTDDFSLPLGNANNYGDATRHEQADLVVKAAECCLDLLAKLKNYKVSIPADTREQHISGNMSEESGSRDTYRELHIHLGIGAGPVFDVHVGGEPGRWEHFIVGDAMEQISVVLDLAKAGELAMSPAAFELFKVKISLEGSNVQLSSYSKSCVILSGFDRMAIVSAAKIDFDFGAQEYVHLWDIEKTPFDLVNNSVSPVVQKKLMEHGLSTGYMRNLDLYKYYINQSALFKLECDIKSSSPIEISQGVSHLLSLNELRQVTTLFIKIGKKEGNFKNATKVHKQLLDTEKQVESLSNKLRDMDSSLNDLYILERERLADELDEIIQKRYQLQRLGNKTLRKSLGRVQSIMMIVQKALSKFHGVLRQFHVDDKGAVLLAFFGLPPFAHRNDAIMAVKAAKRIQRKFSDIKCTFSMGLTTGHISIGGVGNAVRTEYALMGDSINMAARLMCLPIATDGVVCDEKTRNLCHSDFQFSSCGYVSVKGKSHPIAAFIPLKAVAKRRNDGEPFASEPMRSLMDHRKSVMAWPRGSTAHLDTSDAEKGALPRSQTLNRGGLELRAAAFRTVFSKLPLPGRRGSFMDYVSEKSKRSEESFDPVVVRRAPMDPNREVVVGRLNERRTLRIALEKHSLSGSPFKVVLEGPTGQGVTTMENYLTGLASKHGYIALSVVSAEGDRNRPLRAMRQVFRELLQALGSLEPGSTEPMGSSNSFKKCASLGSFAQAFAPREVPENRLSAHPSTSSLVSLGGVRRQPSGLLRPVSRTPSQFRSLSKLNPNRTGQSPLLPILAGRASQAKLHERSVSKGSNLHLTPEKSFADLLALVLSESQGELSLASSLSSSDPAISSVESSINSQSGYQFSRRASEPGRLSFSNVISRGEWTSIQGRRRILIRMAESLVRACKRLGTRVQYDVALAFIMYTILSSRDIFPEGISILKKQTLVAGAAPIWHPFDPETLHAGAKNFSPLTLPVVDGSGTPKSNGTSDPQLSLPFCSADEAEQRRLLLEIFAFAIDLINKLAIKSKCMVILSDAEHMDALSWSWLAAFMEFCPRTAFAVFRKPAVENNPPENEPMAPRRRGTIASIQLRQSFSPESVLDKETETIYKIYDEICDSHVTEHIFLDGLLVDELQQLVLIDWNRHLELAVQQKARFSDTGSLGHNQLRFAVEAPRISVFSPGETRSYTRVRMVHWYMVQRIQEVSDGNPQFVRSIVSSLWDRKKLCRVDSSGTLVLNQSMLNDEEEKLPSRHARRPSAGWPGIRKYSVHMRRDSRSPSITRLSSIQSTSSSSNNTIAVGFNYQAFLDFEKALIPSIDMQALLVAQMDRLNPLFQIILKVTALMGFVFTLDELLHFLQRDSRADFGNGNTKSLRQDAFGGSPVLQDTQSISHDDVRKILASFDSGDFIQQIHPGFLSAGLEKGTISLDESIRLHKRLRDGVKFADHRLAARRGHVEAALLRKVMMPHVDPGDRGTFSFQSQFSWNGVRASMLTTQRRQLHRQLAIFYEEIFSELMARAEPSKTQSGSSVTTTNPKVDSGDEPFEKGSLSALSSRRSSAQNEIKHTDRDVAKQLCLCILEHHWQSDSAKSELTHVSRAVRLAIEFLGQNKLAFQNEILEIGRADDDVANMSRISLNRAGRLSCAPSGEQPRSSESAITQRFSKVVKILKRQSKGMSWGVVENDGNDNAIPLGRRPSGFSNQLRRRSLGWTTFGFAQEMAKSVPINPDHQRFNRIIHLLRQLTHMSLSSQDFLSAAVHGTLLIRIVSTQHNVDLFPQFKSDVGGLFNKQKRRKRSDMTATGHKRARSVSVGVSQLADRHDDGIWEAIALDARVVKLCVSGGRPSSSILPGSRAAPSLAKPTNAQRDQHSRSQFSDPVLLDLCKVVPKSRSAHLAFFLAEMGYSCVMLQMSDEAMCLLSSALIQMGQSWPVPENHLRHQLRKLAMCFQKSWIIKRGRECQPRQNNDSLRFSFTRGSKGRKVSDPKPELSRRKSLFSSEAETEAADQVLTMSPDEYYFSLFVNELLIRLSGRMRDARQWQYLILRTHLLLIHPPGLPPSPQRIVGSLARVANVLAALEFPDALVDRYLDEAWDLLRDAFVSLSKSTSFSNNGMNRLLTITDRGFRQRGISLMKNRKFLNTSSTKKETQFGGLPWTKIVTFAADKEWFEPIVTLLYNQACVALINGHAVEALRSAIAMDEVVASQDTTSHGRRYIGQSLLFRATCHFWLGHFEELYFLIKRLWRRTRPYGESPGTFWCLCFFYMVHSGFMHGSTTLSHDNCDRRRMDIKIGNAQDSRSMAQVGGRLPAVPKLLAGELSVYFERSRTFCDLIWRRLADHVARTFSESTFDLASFDVILYESISLDWTLQQWRARILAFVLSEGESGRMEMTDFIRSFRATLARVERIGVLLEGLEINQRATAMLTVLFTLKSLVILVKVLPGLILMGRACSKPQPTLPVDTNPGFGGASRFPNPGTDPDLLSVPREEPVGNQQQKPSCSEGLEAMFQILARSGAAVADQILERTEVRNWEKPFATLQFQLHLLARFVHVLYFGPDAKAIQQALNELLSLDRQDKNEKWFSGSMSGSGQVFRRGLGSKCLSGLPSEGSEEKANRPEPLVVNTTEASGSRLDSMNAAADNQDDLDSGLLSPSSMRKRAHTFAHRGMGSRVGSPGNGSDAIYGSQDSNRSRMGLKNSDMTSSVSPISGAALDEIPRGISQDTKTSFGSSGYLAEAREVDIDDGHVCNDLRRAKRLGLVPLIATFAKNWATEFAGVRPIAIELAELNL